MSKISGDKSDDILTELLNHSFNDSGDQKLQQTDSPPTMSKISGDKSDDILTELLNHSFNDSRDQKLQQTDSPPTMSKISGDKSDDILTELLNQDSGEQNVESSEYDDGKANSDNDSFDNFLNLNAVVSPPSESFPILTGPDPDVKSLDSQVNDDDNFLESIQQFLEESENNHLFPHEIFGKRKDESGVLDLGWLTRVLCYTHKKDWVGDLLYGTMAYEKVRDFAYKNDFKVVTDKCSLVKVRRKLSMSSISDLHRDLETLMIELREEEEKEEEASLVQIDNRMLNEIINLIDTAPPQSLTTFIRTLPMYTDRENRKTPAFVLHAAYCKLFEVKKLIPVLERTPEHELLKRKIPFQRRMTCYQREAFVYWCLGEGAWDNILKLYNFCDEQKNEESESEAPYVVYDSGEGEEVVVTMPAAVGFRKRRMQPMSREDLLKQSSKAIETLQDSDWASRSHLAYYETIYLKLYSRVRLTEREIRDLLQLVDQQQ
jgi:hypothetical protein